MYKVKLALNFSSYLCISLGGHGHYLFIFLAVEAFSPGPFSFLWICCPSTHGDPVENRAFICMPPCSLHSLLHSAGLSGLLTAAIQVSFYGLMTGVLKPDSF